MVTTGMVIVFLVGIVIGMGVMRYTIMVNWESEGEGE